MILIRDIMFCKPGKARPIVDKFVALSKLAGTVGIGNMRVMTDISAERFWTVVAEMEMPSFEAYTEAMQKTMGMAEFQEIMKGYHDLVDHGRREFYTLEG